MAEKPSLNGRNGKGQFTSGNKAGGGNPYASKLNEWRSVFVQAVTSGDIRAVIRKLVEKAKEGDINAAREVLTRCLGQPKIEIDLNADVTHRTVSDWVEDIVARRRERTTLPSPGDN